MLRRFILCLVILGLCAVPSLFAKGGSEKATITVWDFKYGEVEGAQKPMKEMDAAFMKAYPQVTVNHVSQPNDTYYQIIQAAATANSGPDVVMFHPGTRAIGFDDILAPLDSYIGDVKSQFTAASIAMCSNNGKVKLLPMTMQGFGIYYNKAYFKKAGLDPEQAPKTAAAFLAACEKLKGAGIVPITVGQTYSLNFLMRTLVANVYGPKVGGLMDGSVSFNDPVFKEAVEFVKALVDKGYLEKDGFSRPYFMDGIDKYAGNNGGMFVGLLSDVGNWKRFSDALGAANVGYFPTINFPDGKYKDMQVAQGAGIGFGIMTWSKNAQAAAAYIKFYTTGEGAKIFATATGALSPNTAITGIEATYPVLKSIQQYLKGGTALDYIANNTQYAGYENDAERIEDRLFVTGEITVDQFISQYQDLLSKK